MPLAPASSSFAGQLRLVLLATTVVLAPGAGLAAAGDPPPAPTFDRDIAPIVFNECGSCHHPGGPAPFSLLDYRSVKKHAKQIADVTRKRFMPPWLPAPGYGDFEGARRLTDAQIDAFRLWFESGSEEGAAEDLPPVPSFKDGWQLGAPDLVLRSERAFTLPAAGPDVFRNFIFTVPITSPRYVRALEILPGNTQVVHHANLLVDRTGSARRFQSLDGDIGFPGMKVEIESKTFEPQTHFLFWKPGTVPAADPPDMAWVIDKGTDLILNMHLRTSGKPELVRPTIGLYFTDTAPTRFPMLLQLEHDGALDIPPGDPDFVVTDELTLPLDVELLGIYPHAHYLGHDIQAAATLPGGEQIPLIWIKNWDLDWQAIYRYAHPISLPKGTRIAMRWSYDNSEANPRNPNHPPKRVVAGNNGTDEMSHLWIQVLPRRREDRKVLQEALVRQKLRKYPRDFNSTLSLGAVLQSMGRTQEAITAYRQAVKLRPDDALAQNNLGAAILSTGVTAERLNEAIAHFRESVRARPDDKDALHNLGNALLARGDAAGAAAAFLRIVASDPADADALDRLASAYIVQGNLEEARTRLEGALRASPDHPSALYNLGFVEARTGDLTSAAEHLERSVRLRPRYSDAHNVLGRVYEQQGKRPEAIAEFERAVALDPGNAAARDNLARLSSAAPSRD